MIDYKMPHVEIAKNFFIDWNAINGSNIINNLALQYDRRRKQLSVNKGAIFPMCYDLKSTTGNNWLLFFGKAPSVERYKGIGDINYVGAIYYQTPEGYEVIKQAVGFGSSIYKPGFFDAYRRNLNLIDLSPIDLIKRYFNENGYVQGYGIEDSDDFYAAVCKEGRLLGYLETKDIIVYLEFFSTNEQNPHYVETTIKNIMQKHIVEKINEKDFDKDVFRIQADIIKATS